MKRFKIILLLLTPILGVISSAAQELTGEIITNRLQEKAQILNDYISFLAQKDRSADIKKHYMNQALNLFVNRGEPFNTDSTNFEGSFILTKSAYRNKPVKRRVKDYLQGVMDLRYAPIDLSALKIPTLPGLIDSKSFVKCGYDLFRFSTMITRELAGYIDDTPVYKDITPFEYSIYIGLEDSINGKEYVIYLSEIEVEDKEENIK